MNKVLVELKWIMNGSSTPIIVCDTMEQAKAWIEKKMEGKSYNGTGYYATTEVPYLSKGSNENE